MTDSTYKEEIYVKTNTCQHKISGPKVNPYYLVKSLNYKCKAIQFCLVDFFMYPRET